MPTDEPGYLAAWQQATEHAASPREMAIAGGAAADDFAWIFMAGYQAAIRAVFGWNLPRGWLAYAASEDRSGEKPPLTLRDGCLSGWKTWVAGSDSVSHLVTTAGRGHERQYFLVDRSQVNLQRRPGSNRFLGAMSQGMAQFDNCTDHQALEPADVAAFAAHEARHVRIAYCAHVQARIPDLSAQARLVMEDDAPAGAVLTLLQTHEQALALRPEHWERDCRVISMYTRG